MSPPASPPPEWDPDELGPSLDEVFDVPDPGPYELLQTIHDYFSQETRHDILQVVLGHPQHLVSLTEFAYYVPKSRSTIREQLTDLAAHQLLTQYHHEPNEGVRDLPDTFWGPTELGVALLGEFKLLRGLTVMRGIHDATEKTAIVERHEAAPRPSLPEDVAQSLDYEVPDRPEEGPSADDPLADLRNQSLFAEAAPPSSATQSGSKPGTRSLDELF